MLKKHCFAKSTLFAITSKIFTRMVLFAIIFQKHRNNFSSELCRLREEGERREQRLLEELRQKGQLLTRQNTLLGQPIIHFTGECYDIFYLRVLCQLASFTFVKSPDC
jgi:hypothetical protein